MSRSDRKMCCSSCFLAFPLLLVEAVVDRKLSLMSPLRLYTCKAKSIGLPALKRSRDPSAYCEVEMRPALSWSRGHVIRYVLIGIDGRLWRSVCLIGIYGRLFGREAFQSRAKRAPLLDCL